MDKFRKLAPRSKLLPDCILAWPTQTFVSTSCIMALLSWQDEHTIQEWRRFTHSAVNMPFISAPASTSIFLCSCITIFFIQDFQGLFSSHLHIEHNLPDPTTDNLLHLVCRRICCLQSICLPITVNLMHTIKEQLRQSTYTIQEKLMLWTFTIAFYVFLKASELIGLLWSDIRPHLQKGPLQMWLFSQSL